MEIASPDEEQSLGHQISIFNERKNPESVAQSERNESNPLRRLNGIPTKRTSWNRSLSIRGRESIIYLGGLDLKKKPKQREGRRKLKQKKNPEKIYDFSKEKAYFEEVDAFELLEESPSPNKFIWKMGQDFECIEHDLTAILGRWRKSKLFLGRGTVWPLSKLMETIPTPSSYTTSARSINHGLAYSLSQIRENSTSELSECKSYSATQKSTKEPHSEVASNFSLDQRDISSKSVSKNLIEELSADSVLSSLSALSIKQGANNSDKSEDVLHFSMKKASKMVEVGGLEDLRALTRESCDGESLTAFKQLLMVCKQSCPVKLSEVLLNYW